MKRIFTAAFACAALILTCGCSAFPGLAKKPADIMEALSGEMRAIYDNRAESLPVAVVYTHQGNGEFTETPLYGEDAVNAALDAIAGLTVTRETDVAVADSDSGYSFIAADGSVAGRVSFNGKNLDCGEKRYEVEGRETLAKLDFPARSLRDTLVIDGPDDGLRAFLESCVTELPARIRVERSGEQAYEISDGEVIEDAVSAIYSIELCAAWKGAEPTAGSLSVTFVMADETEFELTIYDGHVYLYEYPEPLSTWTFWTDGAEHLTELLEEAK